MLEANIFWSKIVLSSIKRMTNSQETIKFDAKQSKLYCIHIRNYSVSLWKVTCCKLNVFCFIGFEKFRCTEIDDSPIKWIDDKLPNKNVVCVFLNINVSFSIIVIRLRFNRLRIHSFICARNYRQICFHRSVQKQSKIRFYPLFFLSHRKQCKFETHLKLTMAI